MRLAAIQLNAGPDKQANLARVAHWLRQAARRGAQVALLPENFALMAADDAARLAGIEGPHASPTLTRLRAEARALGIRIIAGGMLWRDAAQGAVHNRCLVIERDGTCVAHYDKIHLFDAALDGGYRESALIRPGRRPVVARLGGYACGLSICYDLRFAELYRHYAQQGCALLSVPAAFTAQTGAAHWEVLLRARAIENQCYVLAAGQWGTHADGRRTWGHSMIVDPWGEVLACLPEGEGVIVAELEPARLRDVRRRLPALAHRRL